MGGYGGNYWILVAPRGESQRGKHWPLVPAGAPFYTGWAILNRRDFRPSPERRGDVRFSHPYLSERRGAVAHRTHSPGAGAGLQGDGHYRPRRFGQCGVRGENAGRGLRHRQQAVGYSGPAGGGNHPRTQRRHRPGSPDGQGDGGETGGGSRRDAGGAGGAGNQRGRHPLALGGRAGPSRTDYARRGAAGRRAGGAP